jgi:toxin-antitoxin system PIN domain toxin
MILCDSNLLLYAYNPSAREHTLAVNWLETVLSGTEVVGFCWPVLSAFLRISTNPRAFVNPLTMSEAVGHVNEWLERKNSAVVTPTTEHWMLFSQMLTDGKIRGAMTTDAEIAAYAIEHGAVLYTSDLDFQRFRSLKIVNPLGG